MLETKSFIAFQQGNFEVQHGQSQDKKNSTYNVWEKLFHISIQFYVIYGFP